FLLARAQDDAVVHGDDRLLIGLAAVGAVIELLAEARADVLALMAFAAGALSDREMAVFAEVIAPGIAIIAAAGLVEDERAAVDLALVAGVLGADAARRAAGEVAVAPTVERLRIRVGGRLLHREAQPRIDRRVGAAGHVGLEPGIGNERAGRIIAEGGIDSLRAWRHRGDVERRRIGRAAGELQRLDEA